MDAQTEIFIERRRLKDRRVRRMGFADALRWGGRRQGFRRLGEGYNRFVDQPSRSVVFMSIFLVAASACDAYFTLLHLQAGAWEANPLMNAALEQGEPIFVGAKMALTMLGVFVLSVHQRFFLGGKGLQFLCFFYGSLLIYHGLLLKVLH